MEAADSIFGVLFCVSLWLSVILTQMTFLVAYAECVIILKWCSCRFLLLHVDQHALFLKHTKSGKGCFCFSWATTLIGVQQTLDSLSLWTFCLVFPLLLPQAKFLSLSVWLNLRFCIKKSRHDRVLDVCFGLADTDQAFWLLCSVHRYGSKCSCQVIGIAMYLGSPPAPTAQPQLKIDVHNLAELLQVSFKGYMLSKYPEATSYLGL